MAEARGRESLDGGLDDRLAAALREEFPALAADAAGSRPIWLDSAATTQKPRCVIDAVAEHYLSGVGNVHRGAHSLGGRASGLYEASRAAVQRLLGAERSSEIVLTSGCTAAINLVARAWGDEHVGPGDEVVVSCLEHHSNLLPWQQLCERRRARLRLLGCTERGELSLEELAASLSPRTRLVALAHVSNTVGAESPIGEVVSLARRVGARVLVDGAQAAPRRPVDVQALGCDFYALSGHKLYAPSGIGALFARRELLAAMPPFLTGGGVAELVGAESSTYAEAPRRFEPGSPNVEGAVGLARAIDWLLELGLERVLGHERALTRFARRSLAAQAGVRLLGEPELPLGVVSFVVEGIHPHDLSTVLDARRVSVRAGHHCAALAHARFGVSASVRASFGVHSTRADVEALLGGLAEARELLGA